MAFSNSDINLKNIIPLKLYETIENAGISTIREILLLSEWDIKRVTNLNTDDVKLLKNIVNNYLCPRSICCNELLQGLNNKLLMISSGCSQVDNILNGGYRRGTITEIYGESGSGKTQLGIQAVACNWPDFSIYISTEDLFPVKRLEAVNKNMTGNGIGQNIFVEHITEGKDLLSCLRVRLPKLLKLHKFSLIILDSVAAPFRCESINYVLRAEELRELALLLLNAAQEYNLAIVCLNQVTASFSGTIDILPSLGLAWSNMVSTRLWVQKLTNVSSLTMDDNDFKTHNTRMLSVIFAPDLPNLSAEFMITCDGIQ